jgi:hypothetical protein
MTARDVYIASVKSAAATKVSTELTNEVTRQTTVDANNSVVGYNLQSGNYANFAASHATARKQAVVNGLAAEAARQIAISTAKDLLRDSGDKGPG